MKKITLLSLFFVLLAANTIVAQTGTPRPFITTWKTDNLGVSDDNTISIPTRPGFLYDYAIDWGDGDVDTNVTGDISHTYDAPDTYTVSISGTFPGMLFNSYPGNEANSDAAKLIEINQWGDIEWQTMLAAFAGCSNLEVVAMDSPDLTNINSLFGTFSYCSSMTGENSFRNWDTSTITDLTQTFYACSNFNEELSGWDVSNVTTMFNLFFGCTSFNQDISIWDVSEVKNMLAMFSGAEAFNQPIGIWNVGQVENMSNMFSNANSFNQDLSDWDVSSVVNLSFMFSVNSNFNQDISDWNVANVQNMDALFQASAFNQDISSWNVSAVNSMRYMFNNSSFSDENYDKILMGWSQLPMLQNGVQLDALQNQYCEATAARQNIIDTYGWTINDGGKATDCQRPFVTTWITNNAVLPDDNQVTIPTSEAETYDYSVDWGDGTSDPNVTGDIMHTYTVPGTYTISITGNFPHFLFDDFATGADRNKLISIDSWGDIEWSSMEAAFSGCRFVDVLAEDSPNLQNVTSMRSMFSACFNLKNENQSLSTWNVDSIVDMQSLFSGDSMFNIDISSWNVSKVEDMSGMFNGTAFNHNIGSWNVANVKNMQGMFFNTSFNQDIGAWNTGQVVNMVAMFSNTPFNFPLDNWDVGNVIEMAYMFDGAASFNQDLSSWNVTNVKRMIATFNNSGISMENYDKMLIGWSQLPMLQDLVRLDAPQKQYCEAKEARQHIIDTFRWIITDAGPETELPIAICHDITVALNNEGIATITADDIDNGSSDNCRIESLSISQGSFTYGDIGPNTVTLTVTDINGNTASCDAQVMVTGTQPLWFEGFNHLTDGTIVDNGSTAWSAVRDGGVFEVFDGRFRVNGSGSGPGTWTSEVINISGAVSVSLQVDDSDQKKERADYLRALYILDGGTPVEFGFVSDDIDPQTFTVDDLIGSTLQIVVESEVSGSPENYYFDNVVVIGETTSGASYTLAVNGGSGDGTYEAGEVVNIVADAAPSGQQFEAWVGDVEAVSDINSATTTLMMPFTNVEITATYSTIPTEGTIWLEDFNDLANYTTVDNGSTAWNAVRDAGAFYVFNQRFLVNNPSSGPGIWTSEVISISGAVSISMDVDDSDQKKERADYLRAYYVLDGSSPVMFGSVSGDIDPQTFTADNLSGNTIQIIVESKVSGSPEYYHIDNIAVSGFSASLTARIGDNAESNTPKSRSPFEIKLYPNPATTQVTTTFDEAVELIDIKVFDMTGRLVKVHRVADQKAKVNYSMDVNELPSGTYFIIMEDVKGKQFRKQMVIGN